VDYGFSLQITRDMMQLLLAAVLAVLTIKLLKTLRIAG
jgi:hypothetical protein